LIKNDNHCWHNFCLPVIMTFPMLQTPLPQAASKSPPMASSAPASRSTSGTTGALTGAGFDATLHQLSSGLTSSPKIGPKNVPATPENSRPTLQINDRPMGAVAIKPGHPASTPVYVPVDQSGTLAVLSSITALPDGTGRSPISAIKPADTKSGVPSIQTKGKPADKSGMSRRPNLQLPQPPSALPGVQPMPIVQATLSVIGDITHGHAGALSALSAGGAARADAGSTGSPQALQPKAGSNELASIPSGIEGRFMESPGITASLPSPGKMSARPSAAHHTGAPMVGTPIIALPSDSVADTAAALPTMRASAQPALSNPASAQVSAALVASGPLSADGSHQLTIALAPPAIGPVTVAIDRRADGTARIAISAVDPVTLSALRNDHAGITQALAQAGITAHESGISFQLAAHASAAIAPIAQAAAIGEPNSGAVHHPSESPSTGQGAVGHQSTGDQSMGQQGAGQSFGDRPSESVPLAARAATPSSVAIGSEPGIPSVHSSNLKKFGLDVTA
jgi:hypothetical protein